MNVEILDYSGVKVSDSTGCFLLDEKLGCDARFFIYCYDLNLVENAIQLITQSSSGMYSINKQKDDYDANIIYVNILISEKGL